jgi:mRNA-degrading endonuclease RelE of RelBE toxin-antitoxin system
MDFRIADTFTESLARLTGEEQKAVKTTAFDLQINPASPGMNFHKLAKSRDKGFWSVRVNQDVRLIVHRTERSMLLCYVAHHDAAYAWAERRKLETHPTTGAAQLVEIRERVQEIVVPAYVPQAAAAAPKQPLFAHVSEADLLAYGVPSEWLSDVRRATEDTIFGLAEHLPAEAAEALLELATGGTPRRPVPTVPAVDPFEHPDARRRFRVVTDVEELKQALEYPWERWIVFLHPAQRDLVERRFDGPARIAGSAGTGKTVVALHRAVHLARVNPDARILLTTFSEALASALRTKLVRLIGTEPRLRERIDVDPLDVVARRLHDRLLGRAELASRDTVRQLVYEAARGGDLDVSPAFLLSEWANVVDAWQLDSWECYRDVARLGRKTRLPEKQRRAFWAVFERVRASLKEQRLVTIAELYGRLAARLAGGERSPYDFVVVDEAQDVSVAQLRFVASLGRARPDALFFAGDLGQRIFQVPFSWKSLGVDIRGRSSTLRMNYRTSHQIRTQADRLLGRQIADVDGNVEDRWATISAFNGPAPVLRVVETADEESAAIGRWLAERAAEGIAPSEMAVFVRSTMELRRAQAAVEAAGLGVSLLDESLKTVRDRVAVGTMHLSKGLEFRAVVVMACDDEILPLQARIEAVTDQGDLEEVYDTERHLLYVACTRARDHLLVTGVSPASEFLKDLGA